MHSAGDQSGGHSIEVVAILFKGFVHGVNGLKGLSVRPMIGSCARAPLFTQQKGL